MNNLGTGEVRILDNNIFDNGKDLNGKFKVAKSQKLSTSFF